MEHMLSDLYRRLVPDLWRSNNGFSPEIAEATELLLKATTDEKRAAILGGWLEKYQPCLFGRVAAKKGLISYCFLTEEDLTASDLTIRSKIQNARTHWTRLAYEGKRSAFVLVALSNTLVSALPNENLLAFAKHLASLYLLHDVIQDEIYMDEIFLETPGLSKATWRWNVGVNYFGVSADKRWWQDHRIPGGLGFSANSVGHLVRSGPEKMAELEQLLGVQSEELVATKISSLPVALEWAMRTIDKASETSSGRATELLPLHTGVSEPKLKCPVALPKFLQDRDYCEYLGYYHTDITIPTEYFVGDVTRSSGQASHRLDFTYLFDDGVANPDFLTTASGRRVRGFQSETVQETKTTRSTPTSELISAHPRLIEALKYNNT
jgi:hypothetical protein